MINAIEEISYRIPAKFSDWMAHGDASVYRQYLAVLEDTSRDPEKPMTIAECDAERCQGFGTPDPAPVPVKLDTREAKPPLPWRATSYGAMCIGLYVP